MIDYRKLEQAHELAKNLSDMKHIYIHIQQQISRTDCSYKLEYGTAPGDFAWFKSIDDLIAYLTELTKTDTKYQVGEHVWVIHSANNLPVKRIIADIDTAALEKYYIANEFQRWFMEHQIYSSQIDLIGKQISYWNNLAKTFNKALITPSKKCEHQSQTPKANSIVHTCVKCFEEFIKPCEHVSDGLMHVFNQGERVLKCKRCGEFYS